MDRAWQRMDLPQQLGAWHMDRLGKAQLLREVDELRTGQLPVVALWRMGQLCTDHRNTDPVPRVVGIALLEAQRTDLPRMGLRHMDHAAEVALRRDLEPSVAAVRSNHRSMDL